MSILSELEKIKPFVKLPSMGWTALADEKKEEVFRSLLVDMGPIETIVEIGTYYGLSTVVLAEYAKQVITVDTIKWGGGFQDFLWKYFGVEKKIIPILVKTTDQKRHFFEGRNFDASFVDGDHMYESAKVDWECVQRCGRVIFHDAQTNWADVDKLIDEIDEKVWIKHIYPPFALVMRKPSV